jgi:chromosome segregation ATPase
LIGFDGFAFEQELGIDPTSATGGWRADEHERFKFLVQSYTSKQRSHASLVDRLRLEFSARHSAAAITAHEQWLELRRYYTDARRITMTNLAAQRAQLFEAATRTLELAYRQVEDAKQHEAEVARLEHRRKVVHRRLDELQAAAAERAQRQADEAAEEAELMEQIRRAEAEQAAEVRQERKARLAEYYRQKEEMEARKQAALAEQQRHEAEEASLRMEYNTHRVQYRQTERTNKEEQARRAKEAEEYQRLIADVRLEALRMTVRSTLNVEDDPSRVLRDTSVSKLHRDTSASDDLAARAPLVTVHGYSSDTLFKDKRFRLASELRDRGLHDTEAGLRAIMMARPHQPTRADSYTSKDSIFHMSAQRAAAAAMASQ